LFSSDAWNNVTLLQERLRNQKEYTTKFISYFDCHRYLYPGKFISSLPMHGTPGASDIAGNGIMFASNDRVGAAAGMIMGNSSVFIMAGFMVSTFGCNSGLILWWAIILCDG
jgi:APA family basic amino acid/polyamine antiporter